jgi:hypothetical protein
MYSRQAKFSIHTSLWTTKAGDSQTPVLRTHIPQMPFNFTIQGYQKRCTGSKNFASFKIWNKTQVSFLETLKI